MSDRIEVEIQFGSPHRKGTKKTYMLSEISLHMLLECNEVMWPDFSKTQPAFVIHENAYFLPDGRLDKVTMLMLSSLERYSKPPEAEVLPS
jgi:hypothetical protein